VLVPVVIVKPVPLAMVGRIGLARVEPEAATGTMIVPAVTAVLATVALPLVIVAEPD